MGAENCQYPINEQEPEQSLLSDGKEIFGWMYLQKAFPTAVILHQPSLGCTLSFQFESLSKSVPLALMKGLIQLAQKTVALNQHRLHTIYSLRCPIKGLSLRPNSSHCQSYYLIVSAPLHPY